MVRYVIMLLTRSTTICCYVIMLITSPNIKSDISKCVHSYETRH